MSTRSALKEMILSHNKHRSRSFRDTVLHANVLIASFFDAMDSLGDEDYFDRVTMIVYVLIGLVSEETVIGDTTEERGLASLARHVALLVERSLDPNTNRNVLPSITICINILMWELERIAPNESTILEKYRDVVETERHLDSTGNPFKKYRREQDRIRYLTEVHAHARSVGESATKEESAIAYVIDVLNQRQSQIDGLLLEKMVVVPDSNCSDYIIRYGEQLEKESEAIGILRRHGYRDKYPKGLDLWLKTERGVAL